MGGVLAHMIESYIKIWCVNFDRIGGLLVCVFENPVGYTTHYIRNVSYASMVLKRWGKILMCFIEATYRG